MKSKITKQTNTTSHAYNIVYSKITSSNMKALINNARRWGIDYNHKKITDGIKDFVKHVIWYYRTHSERVNYKQEYVIYGMHLFIFTMDRHKLITVIDIPPKFRKEAITIRNMVKGKKKKKKNYDEPLRK